MTTNELLLRLRRGDARAFKLLFEHHFEPLAALVTRMVHSRHVAVELVQDVFLRVWSGRAELQVRGDLRSYLRRAARNRALDWLRREDLHREWEQTAEHEIYAPGADAHADEHDALSERQQLLTRALVAMPDRRRAVCELRWREGLGPAAIAQRLGISVKTVETHITRGLKDLRAALRSASRSARPPSLPS